MRISLTAVGDAVIVSLLAQCAGWGSGQSIRLNQSVAKVIRERYPYTLQLTLSSLIVALVLAIPAGVRSARRRNRWDDRVLGFVSLLGLSFPNFALGPILILFFAIKLGWLPVSGSGAFRKPGPAGDHHGRRARCHSHAHGAHVDA